MNIFLLINTDAKSSLQKKVLGYEAEVIWIQNDMCGPLGHNPVIAMKTKNGTSLFLPCQRHRLARIPCAGVCLYLLKCSPLLVKCCAFPAHNFMYHGLFEYCSFWLQSILFSIHNDWSPKIV